MNIVQKLKDNLAKELESLDFKSEAIELRNLSVDDMILFLKVRCANRTFSDIQGDIEQMYPKVKELEEQKKEKLYRYYNALVECVK